MPIWKHGGNWTMSLLSWSAYVTMYKEGRDCNPMFLEFKNNLSTYYQTEEAFNKVKNAIQRKANRNPKFIKQKLSNLEKILKTNPAKLKYINTKLKGKTVALPELFSQYWKQFNKVIFGMAIDIYFDDILVEKLSKFLKAELKKINKEDKFNEYYTLLTAPLKFTTTQQEEIAFLKILLKSEKDRKKLFEQHLKEYAHIPAWFDSEPWTSLNLEKRTKSFKNRSRIRKRLSILQNEIKRRKAKTGQMITELKPSREIKELINNIQRFAFLRQEGEVQIGYNNFQGLKLKEKICDQLNITMDDLKFLTDKEVVKNLKKKKPLLGEIIRERQKYCFMIMKNGKYIIYTESKAKKEAEKIKNKIISQKPKATKIIKGIVGSTGYAKGKVRILHGLSDINQIKVGEIMVVSGTSLEYLSAMQKASAVIAEIGGITSHAAVTCRELKIPCLTRIEAATKIFKDGDLVEVDANKGIVNKN